MLEALANSTRLMSKRRRFLVVYMLMSGLTGTSRQSHVSDIHQMVSNEFWHVNSFIWLLRLLPAKRSILACHYCHLELGTGKKSKETIV